MIPFIVGIIGLNFYEFINHETNLSNLTYENIEALTEGTELPEVTILCSSSNRGQCYVEGILLAYCPDGKKIYSCSATGNPKDFCDASCK